LDQAGQKVFILTRFSQILDLDPMDPLKLNYKDETKAYLLKFHVNISQLGLQLDHKLLLPDSYASKFKLLSPEAVLICSPNKMKIA
jgi:hypothetical protein